MVALTKRDEMITVVCRLCRKHYDLLVDLDDVRSWMDGVYIQDAMPYLSAGERELLISHTCDDCWKVLFGNCEE